METETEKKPVEPERPRDPIQGQNQNQTESTGCSNSRTGGQDERRSPHSGHKRTHDLLTDVLAGRQKAKKVVEESTHEAQQREQALKAKLHSKHPCLSIAIPSTPKHRESRPGSEVDVPGARHGCGRTMPSQQHHNQAEKPGSCRQPQFLERNPSNPISPVLSCPYPIQ